jgi:Serpin (serine protease inhibitor)
MRNWIIHFHLSHNTHHDATDDGPLPSTVVLIVINAIYLKASWAKPFYAERTSKDVFFAADKSTVQRKDAIFMHQMDYFQYSDTAVANYQLVQMFLQGSLSLILAVPTTKNAALTNAAAVISALPQLARQRVALGLPKYEYERTYEDDLKTALRNAGVSLPFDGGHLCIFENDCSPALEIVIQKTFISVDELGVSIVLLCRHYFLLYLLTPLSYQVEAAAVTAGISATSLPVDTPVEVMADLPFQFFIIDSKDDSKNTALVLFEGRVFDPTPQNTTAPFTAKHTDADFWSTNFGFNATRVFDDTPVAAPVAAPVTAPVAAPTPTTQVTPSAPSPVVTAPVTAPVAAPTPTTQVTPSAPSPVAASASAVNPAVSASTIANMALSSALLLAVLTLSL